MIEKFKRLPADQQAFWVLHAAACLFMFVGLFVTVPAHFIYNAVKRGA